MELVTLITTIGGVCGAIVTIVTFITLVIKPLRNKAKNWINKTANTNEFNVKFDDINEKIDKLTELVSKTVEQNETLKEEMSKQSNALQASLRNSILNLYYKCTERGYITMFEKQNVTMLYENYENLKGNSFISGCVKEMLSLKTVG